MIIKSFKDKKLSLLGFGTMRLPMNEDGSIDEVQTREMVDYAIKHGVNYFDTAYPYHGGQSEIVIGKILKDYPREKFYLANKFPGHQIAESYDPKAIFEEQLEKCGVEYFDFYLLHNVYENSIETYMDPKWGILDYFKEQKRLGRIKHLGFSTHGSLETIKKFLDYCGEDMEFCQIQLNYLDWTLQNAKEKYEFLKERKIPVFVMEPLRGGKLASYPEEIEAQMKEKRDWEYISAWAFRFLQGLIGVRLILSGMSNMEHMKENVKSFLYYKDLKKDEEEFLLGIAEDMKKSVPCTACKYCMDACPMGLNIPLFMEVYNELKFSPSVNASMRIECLSDDKKPSACIKCGNCSSTCPQHIQIPEILEELSGMLETMPKWSDISKARAEAAKKLQNK